MMAQSTDLWHQKRDFILFAPAFGESSATASSAFKRANELFPHLTKAIIQFSIKHISFQNSHFAQRVLSSASKGRALSILEKIFLAACVVVRRGRYGAYELFGMVVDVERNLHSREALRTAK